MRQFIALGVDSVLIVVFAVIGRASHESGLTGAGITRTALPFLAAGIIGSLLGSRFCGASWWRSGLITWAVTVLGGIGLRLLGGETAQGAFVVVTAVVLGVLLIGWRGVSAAVAREPRPVG